MKTILKCSVLLYLFCISLHSSGESQAVKVIAIKNKLIQLRVRTFGVLAPNVEEISFQIPGRILKFDVEEGDRVKADQQLAQLQTEDARDVIRKAKTQLENMSRVRDRMEKLHKTGNIQISQLEDTQAQYDQLQIALDQAELTLSRCFMTAPSDGILLKQHIDSRTSVAPGQPIFVFQSDDELWVTKVDLTDRNALLMSTGARAEVTFSPYPNVVFAGTVRKVAQVANLKDGLYTAEISISPQGKELRPGMVAEVDVIKKSDRPFSIVPFDALLDLHKNRGHIYLVSEEGGSVIEKPVTINSIDGDLVALEEDLTQFENVVSQGHHGLRDGATIHIQQ
jgi:RND family efflux transporter MFP subunit